MSEQLKLASRLEQVRRELDEVAEHLARLAADLTASAATSDDRLDLVGVAEVAEITGVAPNTVSAWIKRGKLPTPAATLKAGRVWHRADIEQWKARQS